MAKYVYSKLANDNVFTFWTKPSKGKVPARKEQILIKGGAGVVGSKNLETPLGVVTRVDDAQAEKLRENSSFKKQVEAGFMKIEDNEVEIEKVVDSLTDKRDNADQDTDADFEKEGKKAPTTNKESDK